MGNNSSRSLTESNTTDVPPANQPQVHLHQPGHITFGDVHHHGHQSMAFDVDKAENDLRDALSVKIQQITDFQASESLPLQVGKRSRSHQEAFGRRTWFNETHNERNTQLYNMYELFDHSKNSSTQRANEQCRSQIAKDEYIRKNGNMVGANGIAGIGKTTMTKLIAKSTNDNPSFQRSPLLFYISLRDVDFTKPCSVLRFLTSSMLGAWQHTPESDEALLKKINEADDVYIFTDALDEAREMNYKDVAPTMSLFENATPDIIFKNLYSGHLLPKAKKLLTSRPEAFHSLHPRYTPEFSVTVLGLSDESQESLCQQICGNADVAETIKAMFKSNPALSSLCFIPMFCRMTVFYLLQNINSDLPLISSTDMFAVSLGHCIRSDHFKGDPSSMPKLSRLALDGFARNKLTFDFNALKAADIDRATIDAFMNVQTVDDQSFRFKILDGDKSYYFSHLLWQEFFSAAYLMLYSPAELIRNLLPSFGDFRWYSVVKFLFGLSNPLVLTKMKALFTQTIVDDCSQKRDLLISFLETASLDYCNTTVHSLPSLFSYVDASCFSDLFKYWYLPGREMLVTISSWVYELQDVEVSKSIALRVPESISLHGSILPSDVISLCHLLANIQDTRNLSVGSYFEPAMFVGEGLKILLQNLSATPHKLKKFLVRNQQININNFTRIINDVEELALESCNLSLGDLQHIFQVLRQRSTPMTVLVLTDNHIRRRDVENLSRCIHNIHALELNDCKLTGSDVEVLARNVAELNEPMKWLDVSENDIGLSGFRSLVRCIHNVQVLKQLKYEFTENDVEMLAKKIKDLERPMKQLELTGKRIGSTGARCLCQCIHNIQQLCIEECELAGEDMEILEGAILQRSQPMQSLRVDGNKIEDRGAFAISRCLHKIELLTMSRCNISEEGITTVLSTNDRNERKCEIFGLTYQ